MTHNKIDLPYTRYLAPDGRLTGELPAWADDFNLLTRLYRQMVLTRLFDQKAVALQRTGRIGTYAPTLGQEAIGVAIGSLMQEQDVLVPYYRDTAVQLMRGVKMEEILLYWGGDERGSVYVDPAVQQDFPLCVPIATQSLHACGVATAFKIRGEHRVAVTTCGDGATSKGDFLEALNVAGTWQLPVVFVINNNQWAISTPRRIQSGAPSLAQKAIICCRQHRCSRSCVLQNQMVYWANKYASTATFAAQCMTACVSPSSVPARARALYCSNA